MSELVEFLWARLDEDERVARKVTGSGHWSAYIEGGNDGWAIEDAEMGDPGAIIGDEAMTQHMVCHDPARVLAEVEAKRARVAVAVAILNGSIPGVEPSGDPDIDAAGLMGAQFMAKLMLKIELMPYAEHSDYQQEWRP